MVVMAAGLGSRYGGLKQVEPIGPNGEWIVDYSVYDAVQAGFERVVFVVRDEIEAGFRARFGNTLERVCDVRYVVQSLDDLPPGHSVEAYRGKPWGTGHAVWSCRELVDGPFGVVNADDFYGRGAYESLGMHLKNQASHSVEYVLVGYELSKALTSSGPVSRGVCAVEENGLLIEIVERHQIAWRAGTVTCLEDGKQRKELRPDATVSMNMWGFGKRFMSDLEHDFAAFLREHAGSLGKVEFFLPDVVRRLVQEGAARIRVLSTDEAWFGVTFRDDIARAREEIRKRIDAGKYPARLWSN